MCVDCKNLNQLAEKQWLIFCVHNEGDDICSVIGTHYESLVVNFDCSQIDITIRDKDNRYCIGINNIISCHETKEDMLKSLKGMLGFHSLGSFTY